MISPQVIGPWRISFGQFEKFGMQVLRRSLSPWQSLGFTSSILVMLIFQPVQESAAEEHCDRHCLLVSIETFLAHMSSQRPDWVTVSPDAIVRENAKRISLADSRWQGVERIVSKQTFADGETGHVLARTGVELASGSIAYVSSRLRITDGAIVEVEISFDDRDTVVAENILRLDPVLTTIVPAERRSTKAELERIGRSYFAALTDHRPIVSDFDDVRCNRYHSGNRVTNNPEDAVEGSGARTCVESMQGPWGPAVEHRFPIIEPERGIVVGITLLHFPDNRQMYVSEVFKVLDGKIMLIDNLPVWLTDTETLGFPLE
jgi:hypothetical protein